MEKLHSFVAAADSSFEYQPLRSESEIRLLRLLPGKLGDTISCELVHADLNDAPEYNALSYTWGDSEQQERILLNGQDLRITRNLEGLLRHLRLETESDMFWADAICINQRDIKERNAQVLLMGRIYQSSSRVVAWLGEESEDSEEAMHLTSEMHDLIAYGKISLEDGAITPEGLREAGFDAESKNWGAFWNLWRRPYWTRMWIIQEHYFAGDLLAVDSIDRCAIGVGHQWVPRAHFVLSWLLVRNTVFNPTAFARLVDAPAGPPLQEPLSSSMGTFETSAAALFQILLSARPTMNPHYTASRFAYLVQASQAFEAIDPRDSIFALYGMIEAVPPHPPIDYTISLNKVMEDSVNFAMRASENLTILQNNRTAISDDAASWWPLFMPKANSTLRWRTGERLFRASGTLKAEPPGFSANGTILRTQGYRLGIVGNSFGPYRQLKNLFDVRKQEIRQELLDLRQKLGTHWRSLSSQHRDDLWRCFFFDQEQSSAAEYTHPAPDNYGTAFECLMTDNFDNDEPVGVPEDFKPNETAAHRHQAFKWHVANQIDAIFSNRCYFDTTNGHVGIGPYLTRPSDLVVLIPGGSCFFVLRPKGEFYQLLGHAWVKDAMNGELVDECLENLEEFAIC